MYPFSLPQPEALYLSVVIAVALVDLVRRFTLLLVWCSTIYTTPWTIRAARKQIPEEQQVCYLDSFESKNCLAYTLYTLMRNKANVMRQWRTEDSQPPSTCVMVEVDKRLWNFLSLLAMNALYWSDSETSYCKRFSSKSYCTIFLSISVSSSSAMLPHGSGQDLQYCPVTFFLGQLLKLLVCPNEKFGTQIQKYVKELVGHEISPALYPILFDQIKIIVEKFFDSSGQVGILPHFKHHVLG